MFTKSCDNIKVIIEREDAKTANCGKYTYQENFTQLMTRNPRETKTTSNIT